MIPSRILCIPCRICRHGPNNSMICKSKKKYSFGQIYRIHVARTGPKKDKLILHPKQFKGSQFYIKQKELYNRTKI